jgi:hypothetical protein
MRRRKFIEQRGLDDERMCKAPRGVFVPYPLKYNASGSAATPAS